MHGLGGSHANWLAVAPELARSCRVFALDLAGFGLTRGGGRQTTVHANRRLLHRFVTEVTGGPAILIGNSMGGTIASLETAAAPAAVAGAVLIDPAFPVYLSSRPDPGVMALFAAYFTPAVGSLLMRGRRRVRTPEEMAVETLRLCCVDPGRVPRDVLEAHIELARRREAYTEMDAEFVTATRSLLALLRHRRSTWRCCRRSGNPCCCCTVTVTGWCRYGRRAASPPPTPVAVRRGARHRPRADAGDAGVDAAADLGLDGTAGAPAVEAARGTARPSVDHLRPPVDEFGAGRSSSGYERTGAGDIDRPAVQQPGGGCDPMGAGAARSSRRARSSGW